MAGHNSYAAVIKSLNTLLADYFALYMKTKNFHWHIAGPHFRDYHLMLDEQAAELYGLTDVIAERVRKLGGTTLHSIGEIAKNQRVKDNDTAPKAEKMLAELRKDNEQLVANLKELKALVDEAGDNATSGMLDEWTDAAERRAWFLREAVA